MSAEYTTWRQSPSRKVWEGLEILVREQLCFNGSSISICNTLGALFQSFWYNLCFIGASISISNTFVMRLGPDFSRFGHTFASKV